MEAELKYPSKLLVFICLFLYTRSSRDMGKVRLKFCLRSSFFWVTASKNTKKQKEKAYNTQKRYFKIGNKCCYLWSIACLSEDFDTFFGKLWRRSAIYVKLLELIFYLLKQNFWFWEVFSSKLHFCTSITWFVIKFLNTSRTFRPPFI